MIQTYHPHTGALLKEYPEHSEADLNQILQASASAFREWKRVGLGERAAVMQNLAAQLEREREALADLMHQEMGKTKAEGTAEIDKCIACARFYAKEGPSALASISIPTEAKKSFVCFEPLGPVLAIMPWNFPYWQVVRCAAPALVAGNTVLLKHASNVTGCALALERIFASATGRKNLFRTLVVAGKQVPALIEKKEIAAVSLTGSTDVGRQVAAAAGHALKKCVLELGGSDAYVVLADADLKQAAAECAKSRLINAGQSCIAAKRFIVEKSVIAQFTELFVTEIQKPQLAPMARKDLREQLHEQVQTAIRQGAILLCGGRMPDGAGYFYPATVLAGVKPGNLAFDEELFGPVAAIVESKDEADAIRLANLSSFGLGAAVFTRDLEKAERIAQYELEAGSCFGNALVRSDPRLPFGGIKDSGFGRELSSFGIREFTNAKTIYLAEAK